MNKLDKRDIEDIFALTPMQEGMLFHYLKDPTSDYYFEQLTLGVSGEIDRELFDKAWNFVIQTNEMLRTVFRWEKVDNPVQIVLKKHKLQPGYYEFTGTGSKEKGIEEIKIKDRSEKFDLREVPFRVRLCKLGKDKYVMIISNHHILYDGWSNSIILKEFLQAYDAFSRQKSPTRTGKGKFKEFVRWNQAQDIEKQEKYWRNYLKESRGRGECPVYGSGEKKIDWIENYRLKLPGDTVEKLDIFVKENKITLSVVIYCAWGILLQCYHGIKDVIFDTTVSGRTAEIKGIEDIVGMFINTLPLRIQSLEGETVIHSLLNIAHDLQKRKEHENISRLRLHECGVAGRNLFFDSVVVIENYPLDIKLLTEDQRENNMLQVRSFSISGMTDYDLTIIFSVFNEIDIDFNYDKSKLNRQMISKMAGYFVQIVEAILKDPFIKIAELNPVPGEEKSIFLSFLGDKQIVCKESLEIEYVPPRNEVEKKLVEIWAETLGVEKEKIGIHHNFFKFGGHSLTAMQVITVLDKVFNVKIQVAELFKRPTVRELAAYISTKGKEHFIELEKVEKKDFYELSFNQKRLWLIHQLEPNSSAYNMPNRIVMSHNVCPGLIEKVLLKIARRHESMRTGFQTVNGEPVQFLQKEMNIPFQIIDISLLEEDAKQQERERIYAEEAAAPFDLSEVPLFRAMLVKRNQGLYDFIFNMHHIISDGWSLVIIRDEFFILYEAERTGKSVDLEPLEFQYKDFAAWQNKKIKVPDLKEKSNRFWKAKINKGLARFELQWDYSETGSVNSKESALYQCVIAEVVKDKLNKLAEDNNTSLFIAMFTVFNILLSKFLGQKDIVCAIPAAGREHYSLNLLVGFFVNTLILYNRVDYEMNFLEFLRKVNENTLEALQYQGYPLELVLEDLNVNFPRIDFFFNMLNLDSNMKKEKYASPAPLKENIVPETKFDMVLYISEYKDAIEINCHYRKILYKPSQIASIMGKYIKLIEFFTNNPRISIAAYKSPGQKRSLKRG